MYLLCIFYVSSLSLSLARAFSLSLLGHETCSANSWKGSLTVDEVFKLEEYKIARNGADARRAKVAAFGKRKRLHAPAEQEAHKPKARPAFQTPHTVPLRDLQLANPGTTAPVVAVVYVPRKRHLAQ